MKFTILYFVSAMILLQPLYGSEQACTRFNEEMETFILEARFSPEQIQQMKDRYDTTLGFSNIENVSEKTASALRNDSFARCLFHKFYYEQAFQHAKSYILEELKKLTLLIEKIGDLEEASLELGEMDYYDYLGERYDIKMK